ncbi:MAG: TrmH family RNA methyltransferase [Phycisphaerales bacterium]
MERLCEITYLDDDEALFAWCAARAYAPVAIEVAPDATRIDRAAFPASPALIVGHEGRGLSDPLMARCDSTVVIPQFGPVACLNVATSAAIAMYECRRDDPEVREITRNKFHVELEDRVPEE